jgi:hypothetical protein
MNLVKLKFDGYTFLMARVKMNMLLRCKFGFTKSFH